MRYGSAREFRLALAGCAGGAENRKASATPVQVAQGGDRTTYTSEPRQ